MYNVQCTLYSVVCTVLHIHRMPCRCKFCTNRGILYTPVYALMYIQSLCMYTCIVHTRLHLYKHVYPQMCKHTCVSTHVYTHMCMHTRVQCTLYSVVLCEHIHTKTLYSVYSHITEQKAWADVYPVLHLIWVNFKSFQSKYIFKN
jgi:hypothetical protein